MPACISLALSTLAALASLAVAHPQGPRNIDTLVIFGDSYTDVDRPFDGGTAWPNYARMYGNFSMHSYARAGQSCSSKLTPRPDIPAPFLVQDSTPEFLADHLPLNQAKTLYTVWIGTNDVGLGNLVTNDATPGTTVVDTTKCLMEWIDYMYKKAGARNFLFMNMIPLQRTILYGPNGYPWAFYNKPFDAESWTTFIQNVVPASNALADGWLRDLAPKLGGSHIGILDTYSLFDDMYHNPSQYLNGTLPLNVDSAANACRYEPNGGPVGGACPTPVTASDERDSYLWWDELHPGEQANRIVAMEVKNSVKGGSKWVEWLN